ncbi:PAS domain S-box protein [Hoeflea sp. G2-23]|uniref:histidine kinase n=1 Tax=Hoeflea algicola TaxID=2983763 RepID=A0ABT3Z5H5_9HYPH|nr:PAS domain S-box protein [Hoeflea algicola]MCY0147026.1 PAS domain S-box protein [Hoeflea algicola]
MARNQLLFSPDDLLTALYETLPDPVLIGDRNRTIVAANAAAVTAFGYSEDELLGMSAEQIYASPDTLRDVGDAFYPLGKEAMRLHRQVDFRRRDGSIFPVDLTMNRIFGSDGEAVGVVALVRDLTDIMAAQVEQLQAEKTLKLALAAISEGFVIFDAEDRLFLCNDAYRDIYKLSAPALQPGQSLESILRYGLERGQYPDAGVTTQEHEAWLKARLEKHNKPSEPIIQRVSDDRWIQIDEQITPENFRVGLRTDISAVSRIKSEAERLGVILERVAQEVYVVSIKNGHFVSCNKSARENLQFSSEEMRGFTPAAINADLSEDELAELIAPLVSGASKLLTFDAKHRRKDGSTYMCRMRLERLDDVPEPVIMAFAEDISERLEFERALERKQLEFETLVQDLPDFITRSRPNTTLTYVNENYARFTGMNAEQLVGQRFVTFAPVEVRSELLSHLSKLTPEQPIRTMEQLMISHTGDRRWYLWSNLMIFKDGVPVELVSVGRDVTESRMAREQIAAQSRELAKRNDALGQFGGIVAHDLKAPLRHIRVFADLIAEDVGTGKTDDLADFSGHISDRVEALERMISSLFTYSQFAYQTVKPVRFKLSRAITEAWENLGADVLEAKARLIAETEVEVYADPDLLTQMLQNLFANSLKYTDGSTPPQVQVDVEVGEADVTIAVEDNGIGIASAHVDNIFGVFQRLHRDESQYPGAGIGLALCRSIADSHGGTIVLDPSCHTGARFIIRLPVAQT